MLLALWVLLLPLSAKEELRVLMIGNSYTAQTRQAVEGFLRADSRIDLTFEAHAPGGRFLDQHAKNPKVAKLLEREWDVVVVQEQSQLPAFAMIGDAASKKRFEEGGRALLAMVRESPGDPRVLLFQTWARHGGGDKHDTLKHFDGEPEKMQDALAEGYEFLAEEAGGKATVVEVGRAFERWYAAKGYDDPRLSLHRPDGSHPSKAGAYLTGAMFYRAITGRDPAKVPFRGGLDGRDGGRVFEKALLQVAAPPGKK